MRWGAAASYRLAAFIFFCAWVALCWPWLSGAVTIPFDAKAHFQAQIQFMAQALHSGQSPFWTPNVFGGSPQVADPQSLIFSPALILAALDAAPSFRVVDAYVLAHLLVAGLAMILFFRDRGWHPAGGLLAALVFAFGASAAWRVQHVGQIASFAFFGLALWLTARMLQRGSVLWGAAAGAAAGLMVLEPDQVALLGAYIIVTMVLWHWASAGRAGIRASLPGVSTASIVGLATIMLPLLWTWLFAEATTRPAIDFAEAARGSLHPASLLTAIVPDLFGARDPGVDYWGPYSEAWNASELFLSQNMGQVYVGALPLLLLLVPGLTRGWLFERAIRPFSLMLGLLILFALGRFTPLFHFVYDWFPGIKVFRRPADATFLIGGLAAIVGGYLLHRIMSEDRFALTRCEWALGAGSAAGLGAVGLGVAWDFGHLRDALWPSLTAAAWLGTGFLVLACLGRLPRATASLSAMLITGGVVAADLRANNGPNESTALDPAIYDVLRTDTRNETVRVLKELTAQPAGSPRRDRVELLGLGFEWPNAGMIHGFDHTLGYNPLRLAEFSDAVGTRDTIAGPDQRKFTPLFPSYRCRLADFLGLRYIASKVPVGQVDRTLKSGDLRLVAYTKDGFIYENPRAMPRVLFVGGWQQADFEAMTAAGVWPAFDPLKAILLEEAPPLETAPGPIAAEAKVRLVSYRNTEVTVEVATEQAGFVVLNDIWHPWWAAEIDGVEAPILKANVLFRAVQVPAGTHRIVFSFRPVEGAITELAEMLSGDEPEALREFHREPAPAKEEGPAIVERGAAETNIVASTAHARPATRPRAPAY